LYTENNTDFKVQNMDTKQVIVMRKDLKMRKGKMIAQGAHASMLAILKEMYLEKEFIDPVKEWVLHTNTIKDPLHEWLAGRFTKITVGVMSEDELFEIYEKALSVEGMYTGTIRIKMPCAIIQDSGKTEFHGIPTYTCAAIGPWWVDEIDDITGGLPLL
jgi:PTH2 family peptidyl-tRNA hydrolase